MTILLDLMGEQGPLVNTNIIEWELHVKIKEACRGSTDYECVCKQVWDEDVTITNKSNYIHVCNCYCWISLLNHNSYRGMHLVRTPNECHTCL